jgi:hypothetical protein
MRFEALSPRGSPHWTFGPGVQIAAGGRDGRIPKMSRHGQVRAAAQGVRALRMAQEVRGTRTSLMPANGAARLEV